MKNRIKFGDLRRLLLDIGFRENAAPGEIVFRHEPSDTLFVFRPYKPADAVSGYNLIEVKGMLDARGLLPADSFERQFLKAPA